MRSNQTAKTGDGVVELEEVTDEDDEGDEDAGEADNQSNALYNRVDETPATSTTKRVPPTTTTELPAVKTTSAPVESIPSPPTGWTPQELAFLQQLMKLGAMQCEKE